MGIYQVGGDRALPGVERRLTAQSDLPAVFVADRYVVALCTRSEAGSASTYRLRGTTWTTRPGTAQVYAPGDVHADLRVPGPEDFVTFKVDTAAVDEAATAVTDGRSTPGLAPGLVSDPALTASVRRLGAAFGRPDVPALTRQTLASELLVALVTATRRGSAPEPAGRDLTSAVVRALEILDDDLTAAPSLDELAAECGVSKFHLVRTFRAALGVSPHQYLLRRRVTFAARLLRAGTRCSEVAQEAGFYDQSQLSRHFAAKWGTTPARYARSFRA